MLRIGPAPAPPTTVSTKPPEPASPAARPVLRPDRTPNTFTPAAAQTRASLDPARLSAADAAAAFLRLTLPSSASGHDSVVNTDVPSPNFGPFTDPKSQMSGVLSRQVSRLAPQASAIVEALEPGPRAAYASIESALTTPAGLLALQQLLFEGTLFAKDLGGGTTLTTLAKLADPKTVLAPGLDRARLLTEVLHELAQPSSISQENKNTCGPTTVGIYLASTAPAELARIVVGLASAEGTVELAHGRIRRNEASFTQSDGSTRTSSQRLLEPALMDLGNTALLGYDNAKDKHTLLGVGLLPGALPSMVSNMLSAVLGVDVDHAGGLLLRPGASALDRAAELCRREVPVPTMLTYGPNLEWDSIHWVMARTLDDAQATFVNPWGREETMPRADFDKRLRAFVFTEKT